MRDSLLEVARDRDNGYSEVYGLQLGNPEPR